MLNPFIHYQNEKKGSSHLLSTPLCTVVLKDVLWLYLGLKFPVPFLPQDTVYPPLEADTVVWRTAPTCMCLVATTQTLRRQGGQKMKIILFSGSFGGFILPQPPGSRSAQRVTCPQSWRQCQVRTDRMLLLMVSK